MVTLFDSDAILYLYLSSIVVFLDNQFLCWIFYLIFILCWWFDWRIIIIKKTMEFLLLLFGYIKNVFLFAGKRLLLMPMGWLTKILKGSSHKYSDGQANRRYNREDRSLDTPRYSAVKWSSMFLYLFIQYYKKKMLFMSSGRIWFWQRRDWMRHCTLPFWTRTCDSTRWQRKESHR